MLRISNIDLRTLSVFLEVVEQEGFSAAAEARGTSLSKITRDVAAIEQRVGMRLCNRGRSGFSLTRAGDEVYRAARELVDNVRGFENQIATIESNMPHALIVGIVDNMVANPDCPVIEAVRRLTAESPGLTLSINVHPVTSVDFKVRDRISDIGFTTRSDMLAPLKYAPAFVERHALFVSRTCPDFERFTDWVSGKNTKMLPYVRRSFAYQRYTEFEAAMPFQTKAAGDSLESVLTSVVAGVGAGLLPRHAAAPYEHLVELDVPDSRFDIPFNVVMRRDASPRSAAAKLFRLIRDAARET